MRRGGVEMVWAILAPRRVLSILGLGILLIVAACSPGERDESVQTDRWMQELFSERPETRLSAVLMPGTHDSGAVDIRVSEPCSDVWIEGTDVQILEAAEAEPCRAAEIAKAQNLSLGKQLRAGIRYLDLRVGTAEIGGTDRLVIHHDLVAEPLEDGLDQILEVAATSREFFVFDFQGVAISDPELLQRFLTLLETHVPESASVPAGIEGLCDLAVDIGERSEEEWARTATFGDVWEQPPRNSLVLVPGNVPFTDCTRDRTRFLASPWPDTTDPDTVRQYAEAVLEQRQAALEGGECTERESYECGFFVSQLQLSPGLPATNRVTRCVEFGIGLCSLEAAAELVNPEAGAWLEEWCDAGLPVNIAILDYFERSDMVGAMLDKNRDLSRDGCRVSS